MKLGIQKGGWCGVSFWCGRYIANNLLSAAADCVSCTEYGTPLLFIGTGKSRPHHNPSRSQPEAYTLNSTPRRLASFELHFIHYLQSPESHQSGSSRKTMSSSKRRSLFKGLFGRKEASQPSGTVSDSVSTAAAASTLDGAGASTAASAASANASGLENSAAALHNIEKASQELHTYFQEKGNSGMRINCLLPLSPRLIWSLLSVITA